MPAPGRRAGGKLGGSPLSSPIPCWRSPARRRRRREIASRIGGGPPGGAGAAQPGFFGFDGPVRRATDWAFVKIPDAPIEMLYHRRGQGYKAIVKGGV